MKQLWDLGLIEYVSDMWNIIDFITNSLYVATVALRVIAYFQVSLGLFILYVISVFHEGLSEFSHGSFMQKRRMQCIGKLMRPFAHLLSCED